MTGFYFEDFFIGQKITSAKQVVKEKDIQSFADLTGDANRIHLDDEFARGTIYGQRIAHGLLVLSTAVGLLMKTGVLDDTVMAFREIIQWRFSKPVFIGDNIHVESEVREVKGMPRLGGGLVTVALDVKNQKDGIVMQGTLSVLVASKPG